MDQTTELSPEIKSTEVDQMEVNKWIKELLEKGYQRVQSPQQAANKNFILTARRAKTEGYAGGVTKKTVFFHSDWNGVNEVFVLDIFEEIASGDSLTYKPVGHRDYRIARLADGVIAGGNRGARRHELTRNSFNDEQPKDPLLSKLPFREVDKEGYINGVDVGEEYRGLGFGKLLAASSMVVLKQLGVEEEDFNGKLSKKFQPIMIELGHRPEVVEQKTYRQKISEFSEPKIAQFIRPFIKHS